MRLTCSMSRPASSRVARICVLRGTVEWQNRVGVTWFPTIEPHLDRGPGTFPAKNVFCTGLCCFDSNPVHTSYYPHCGPHVLSFHLISRDTLGELFRTFVFVSVTWAAGLLGHTPCSPNMRH